MAAGADSKSARCDRLGVEIIGGSVVLHSSQSRLSPILDREVSNLAAVHFHENDVLLIQVMNSCFVHQLDANFILGISCLWLSDQ